MAQDASPPRYFQDRPTRCVPCLIQRLSIKVEPTDKHRVSLAAVDTFAHQGSIIMSISQ